MRRGHCKDAVYNGINLFDLVALWRTNRISETLQKTMRLRATGVARKTYHFINIPLERRRKSRDAVQTELEARLPDKALERLKREEDFKAERDAVQGLEKADEDYPILIRGAIRNYGDFHKESL